MSFRTVAEPGEISIQKHAIVGLAAVAVIIPSCYTQPKMNGHSF